MNIENFSTTNLPGLGDTKNQASIKGDDPGPIGPVGYSATGVGRGNLTSTTSTGIGTNSITISSSNPYAYGPIKTERLPRHAKGSRVLSIEGDYGLSCLIKSYIGSELDVIYTYLTINGFKGPSGELFVEKAPMNLIHRSRKK